MRVLGKIMHHVRLITRMADATGTDLVSAHRQGALNDDQWAGMVQTCRACEWAGRCQGWLDAHPNVGEAPDTCPNRDQFDRIRAATRREEEAL